MTASPVAITGGGALHDLVSEGVSPWLDGIHGGLLTSGALTHLIENAGIRGATSNPAVLAEAVASDPAYREQLTVLAQGATADATRALTVYDARRACEELYRVYDATRGRDGLVSMDMDPGLARDAESTVAEAVALVRAVDRPNLLVKIPATTEGLTAIGDCLARGIGVHVTEVFSVACYNAVADAYTGGLERALADGRRLSGIASVASLPVSRLDSEVNARLGRLGAERDRALAGGAAIANARILYRCYEELLGSGRWRTLRAAGARPQRLMWTSTTVPDPVCPPTSYVDGLVAWGTVIAVTLSTLEAIDRGGNPQGDTLTGEHEAAHSVLDELGRTGISFDAVVRKLEAESLERSAGSWQALRAAVGRLLGSTAEPAG